MKHLRFIGMLVIVLLAGCIGIVFLFIPGCRWVGLFLFVLGSCYAYNLFNSVRFKEYLVEYFDF